MCRKYYMLLINKMKSVSGGRYIGIDNPGILVYIVTKERGRNTERVHRWVQRPESCAYVYIITAAAI